MFDRAPVRRERRRKRTNRTGRWCTGQHTGHDLADAGHDLADAGHDAGHDVADRPVDAVADAEPAAGIAGDTIDSELARCAVDAAHTVAR
jgi:hypothetical protein